MNESENKFLAVIRENEIDVNEGNQLAVKFTGFMDKMAAIETEAKAIVVTDVSQKEEMQKARQLRLTLKDMRVESEKVRVALKEDSLKKGKVIDALAKIVKDTITPIEEYLDLQEKYAENLEKQRIEKQNADRFEKISKYADPSLYNYKEMSDRVVDELIAELKITHDRKVEEEKKAEAERIEKERLEKEQAEKNRVELERLKKENEEREKKEKTEAEAKQAEELKRQEEKAEMERKHEAELKAERDRAEALEKEAKEKELKEAQDRKLEEDRLAKIKAETEEAERQKALAPEKDKLFAYAEAIKATESPQGLSAAGLAIVANAEAKLLAISQEVKEALKNL